MISIPPVFDTSNTLPFPDLFEQPSLSLVTNVAGTSESRLETILSPTLYTIWRLASSCRDCTSGGKRPSCCFLLPALGRRCCHCGFVEPSSSNIGIGSGLRRLGQVQLEPPVCVKFEESGADRPAILIRNPQRPKGFHKSRRRTRYSWHLPASNIFSANNDVQLQRITRIKNML